VTADPPRGIPISIWKYAHRVIGTPETVTMSNTHCVNSSDESTDRCFGVWAPAGQFLHLVHTATLATIQDPRYEPVGPTLSDMLPAASGHNVGAGVLFTFPGWIAIDAIGRPWKGI
jgi:hypothetical protein